MGGTVMKKRVLGLLLSMTMVAGMLTACGGNANTAASTGASADGNAADATAADTITVTATSKVDSTKSDSCTLTVA